MGKRLYVASKYEIDFGGPAEFNWQVSEFHCLLDALGIYYSGDEYDDEFDVEVEQWNEGIDKMNHLDTLEEWEREDIESCAEKLGYTVEQLIDVFEQYLKSYDKNNEYLHFCFM